MRDVGALELALMVLFGLSALWLTRRLVQAALIAQLFWAVPHLVYHLAERGTLGDGDYAANGVALAVELALPLALLWLVPRARLPG